MIARTWLVLSLLSLGWCELAAFAQSPTPTTVEVSLPADAQLWVNGRLTTSTGDVREFRDSQSLAGGVYRYELRAVAERHGQTVSQLQVVRLSAGNSTRVQFDFPSATTAMKPTQPSDYLLVQDNSLRRNQFQPRATDSELPAAPALGSQPSGRFQPRQPDLGSPDSAQPSDDGVVPPEQPDLGDPSDTSGFGRQYGDEPEPDLGGNELPAPSSTDGDRQLRLQPLTPDYGADAGSTDGSGSIENAPSESAPPVDGSAKTADGESTIENLALTPWLAFICGDEQHHLTGNTGTVLHVWQHRWRMVRLARAPNLGPYLVYNEVGHQGFRWAYGPADACRQSAVYFKAGANARWHLMGSFRRVRPFTN